MCLIRILTLIMIFLVGFVSAETTFFEAEDMCDDETAWEVKDDGWQTGSASKGGMLWGGNQVGQGVASNTILVTTTAVYRVWLRYVDTLVYRGPFRIDVYQGDVLLGSKDCDLESLRTNEEGVAKWGGEYGRWVWDYVDIPLTSGNVTIVVTKLDPVVPVWVTRRLDCFVLSTDLAYEPKISDFVNPLWIKIEMGPTPVTPCVIHLFGRRPRGPIWYLKHCNIWESGMVVNQHYTGINTNAPPTNALMAGESSSWVNIAPLLDPVGENSVQLYAMQEYNTGLANSDFTVHISNTVSETNCLYTFARSGSGSGVMLLIDLMRRDQIKSDLECSREEYDMAMALDTIPGQRPRKFPMVTGCFVDPAFYRESTISNEITTLSILGFDGLKVGGDLYQPVYYDNGFHNLEWGSSYFHLTVSNDLSAPNMDAIELALDASVQAVVDSGHAEDIESWLLTDEPGSMSMSHIAEDAGSCRAGFHAYLQGEGLMPADFGESDWGSVLPVATTNRPKEYYYTALFRCQILTDMFRLGTARITATLTNAPTSVNFAEEATYNGNLLYRGVDWFAIFDQNALRMGWTEDWLNHSATYQLCGYRADLLRAACGSHGRPFRMYNILRSPWDSQAKPIAEIGHGARAIYHYNYGPFYGGGDAMSQSYELYPAIRAVNYAVGAVEDYLEGATVPRSKIAFLCSNATDIWTMNQPWSVFGKNRMGLYLILRHLGHPVDIVTENDVASGKLGDYAMLICDGSHLHADALAPLVSWLNAGGVLYMGAGSLTYDQFNAPLGFDTQVGLVREPFEYVSDPGREYYELPVRPDLAPVNYSGIPLESVCGYQKVSTNGTEQVLATFTNDGTAAVFIKDVGSGKLAYSGFFPGLAYQKQAVITMKARNAELTSNGSEIVTYGSTDFPAGYRTFFASLLSAIQPTHTPPVMTGNYLVEANRLDGPKGSVITLSNWTGASITNLNISFKRKGRAGLPFTAINPIKNISETDDVVTVTLDLAGPGDFIVIPQKAAL